MSGVVKAIKKGVKSIVKGVTKIVKGVVKAVVGVVKSVVNFIAQPFLGLLGGMPSMPDAATEADRQQGVTVTTQGSNVNLPVVYGYRQVGGTITFAETGSDNNRYLWVAYALSEGPVEGLREIYIDDNQLPANVIPLLNNGRTVSISTGKYKDRVQIQFHHGIYRDNPSSSTVGTFSILSNAPSWKNTMVYNGVATLFVRYEWKKIETDEDAENNPFSGNIPALKVGLLGRKLHSLTDGSTPENYTYDSSSNTTRYSFNPADILLDYLRNPRYGKGLTNNDIDWDSFRTAANKCATTVTYINGVTGPIMTGNYVLDTGMTLFANVKTLLMGFRAYLPYSQGKYKLKIEDAGNATDITSGVATIVATFDEDNIQGPVTYSAVERTSKYNQVQINYVDPDKKFTVESVIYPETDSERQEYIEKDGGRVNKLEATFPTITNYAIAKDYARLLFNKSRFQESVSFTASSQALELEVGDNIYIQSKMLNFSTTPFRVVSMRINNDMTVDLGCVRNDDSLYPHTRVGEEDIVLPPYIPKGATIDYPEELGGYAVGLLPPTNAVVPITFLPPKVNNVLPGEIDSAGLQATLRVIGERFEDGATVHFIGNDSTVYAASDVDFQAESQININPNASMTQANNPYDVRVTNPVAFGSLTSTLRDAVVLDIDGNAGDADPGDSVSDPPITDDPPDDSVTPPPTDPPPGGPPPTNPPPNPPVQVVTFDDFIEITRVEYTVDGDLVYAECTGAQPDRADYKELIVYYKRYIASETVYQQTTVTTSPGANLPIKFRLGPLIKGRVNYQVKTRVKYTTGELSTFINTFYLDTSGAVVAVDPQDYPQIAATGWPADPGEATKFRDTNFDKIAAQTLLTGAQPKDPKEIEFTVREDTFNNPANYDVTGIAYYVKASAESQWTRYERAFSNPYVPGAEQTFTLDIFGSPAYPSVPSTAQQNYDFIFRFVHKDGTESTRQWRFMNIRTEYSNFGTYNYNPLYGAIPKREKATDFEITLVDPSVPSAASSMTVNLHSIETRKINNRNNIAFFINPPDASVQASWRGFRLRYRKVVPGTDPDFETYESTSTQLNINGRHFLPLEIDYDDVYEWVITPLYSASGTRTDSTESLFGVGYIHNKQQRDDYPSNNNWLQTYNFRDMKTTQALKTIDEAFPAPANPLVEIVAWTMSRENFYSQANEYYKLTFNHHAITNFTALNIYRRRNDYGAVPDANNNFYGYGRWEKVVISSLQSSPTSTTVFLRPPLFAQEYNPYYNGSNDLRYSFAEGSISGYGASDNDEFLIVADTSSGESTVGWFLPGVGGSNGETDILQGQRATQVNLSDYSNFDALFEKNLNQAITAITIANTKYNYRSNYSNIVVTKTPAIV